MFSQTELSEMIQKGLDEIEYPNLAPRLFDPVKYMLAGGGKRVRPTLVLMAANLFTDDIQDAVIPAVGLEMYHNFTLLHDDVMDKAPERHGRETVHLRWNENVAILSGDAMQALAYQLIAKTPSYCLKEVLDIFNQNNIEIDQGQQLDMEFETRDDVTLDEYIEMIRLKTSVMLGAALKMGAIIGKATPERAQILYDFGMNLGVAFQLQDDWLDCWGNPETFGKRIGGDILCNKKTYLRIKAESKLSRPESYRGQTEEDYIEMYKNYYILTGAEASCRKAISEYVNKANACLDQLNMPDEKLSLLKALASKLENRNA
ncbi:MAG: polyprenyl synthetase family protein [Bacteroidales bacterium]|nr:polyprenyl synthetase family protein [Bacteroidales bacterium]